MFDGISRYQYEEWLYRKYDPNYKPFIDLTPRGDQPPTPQLSNFKLSGHDYFTGNWVEQEADLDGGLFVDFTIGLQKYRDEEGNVDWYEPK